MTVSGKCPSPHALNAGPPCISDNRYLSRRIVCPWPARNLRFSLPEHWARPVGMRCPPLRNGMVLPSRRCALAVTSFGTPVGRQWPGCSPTIRGEPAIAREDRAATLYSVAPRGSRTMKQSFASAARLRGDGTILTNGSMTMFWLGSPPPRIVSGQPGRTNPAGRAETCCLRSLSAKLIRPLPATRRRAGDFALW